MSSFWNHFIVSWQHRIQTHSVPATWIPLLRNTHREESEWTFDGSSVSQAQSAIQAAAQALPGYHHCMRHDDKSLMIVDYLTPTAKWLDQMQFVDWKEESNSCRVRVIYSSTGLVPLTVPFAVVLNVIFCWVPFGDNGVAESVARRLCDETSKHLPTTDDTRVEFRITKMSLTNPKARRKKRDE